VVIDEIVATGPSGGFIKYLAEGTSVPVLPPWSYWMLASLMAAAAVWMPRLARCR